MSLYSHHNHHHHHHFQMHIPTLMQILTQILLDNLTQRSWTPQYYLSPHHHQAHFQNHSWWLSSSSTSAYFHIQHVHAQNLYIQGNVESLGTTKPSTCSFLICVIINHEPHRRSVLPILWKKLLESQLSSLHQSSRSTSNFVLLRGPVSLLTLHDFTSNLGDPLWL